MEQHSINLRPAKSALDEGLVFAHYLDQAAEGFFRFMFGRQSEQIIATAFTQTNHDLSYQNVIFAERNNVIVGMASGYTAEQHHHSSPQPVQQAAGLLHLRMWIVLILFAPVIQVIDSVADGDFYLQAIAVDKDLRGGGVGSILMDHFEEKARMSGSGRLCLDVSAQNEGACRLYKRRGMTIESQWPKRFSIPGLKLYRMVKTL